jgi:hypothetical protein
MLRCCCLSCLVAVWLRLCYFRRRFIAIWWLVCASGCWLVFSSRRQVVVRFSQGRLANHCASLLFGHANARARTARVCSAQVGALGDEFSSRAAGLKRGGALPNFAKPASLKPWRAPTRCLTTPEGIPKAHHAKLLVLRSKEHPLGDCRGGPKNETAWRPRKRWSGWRCEELPPRGDRRVCRAISAKPFVAASGSEITVAKRCSSLASLVLIIGLTPARFQSRRAPSESLGRAACGLPKSDTKVVQKY